LNRFYSYCSLLFTLLVAIGCDLNDDKDLQSYMNLEGSWKIISVVEPDCKRCPESWPRRKFLSHQFNIGDTLEFSKNVLTYRSIAKVHPEKLNFRINEGSVEILGSDWVWPVDVKKATPDTLKITLGQSVMPDAGTELVNRNMYVTLLRQ
jgi:hypothetical protein